MCMVGLPCNFTRTKVLCRVRHIRGKVQRPVKRVVIHHDHLQNKLVDNRFRDHRSRKIDPLIQRRFYAFDVNTRCIILAGSLQILNLLFQLFELLCIPLLVIQKFLTGNISICIGISQPFQPFLQFVDLGL